MDAIPERTSLAAARALSSHRDDLREEGFGAGPWVFAHPFPENTDFSPLTAEGKESSRGCIFPFDQCDQEPSTTSSL